ncbi:MAG: flagellar basal body L-ring protein FlgH [Chlorobiota bacterium]
MIALLLSVALLNVVWAQWSSYGLRSLTSDVRARGVGDVVTILVIEDAQASNAAQTGEQRRSDFRVGAQGSYQRSTFRAEGGFQGGAQFQGRGETSRSERIRARLTARVVAVDTLGNLVLEGERTTRINGETQAIRIRGTVRPADILSDNTVPSWALSELTLIYEGDGIVSRAQEPGLIARLLRLLF